MATSQPRDGAAHKSGADGSAVAAPARPGPPGFPIDEILRLAIRQGLLPPGSRLIQRNIAAVLGVSRIPVREALRQLAAEGLVTFTSGQSATVTEMSPEDIEELYSLRLMVEPAMAAAIVRNHAPADRVELEHLVGEMDRLTGVSDQVGWSDANFRFHDVLYRSSGLRQYHRISSQLLTLTETYSRVFVFELAGRDESQQEHHQMLEALAAGDAPALEKLLHKHLFRAHRDLVGYTRGQGSAQGPAEGVYINDLVKQFAEQFMNTTSRGSAAGGG